MTSVSRFVSWLSFNSLYKSCQLVLNNFVILKDVPHSFLKGYTSWFRLCCILFIATNVHLYTVHLISTHIIQVWYQRGSLENVLGMMILLLSHAPHNTLPAAIILVNFGLLDHLWPCVVFLLWKANLMHTISCAMKAAPRCFQGTSNTSIWILIETCTSYK